MNIMDLDLRLLYELGLGGLITHLLYKRRKDEEKKEHNESRLTKLEVQHDNLGNKVDEISSDTKDIKKSLENVSVMLAELRGKSNAKE